MGIEQTGVAFAAQGYTEFVGALKGAGDTYQKMTAQITQGSGEISKSGGALDGVLKGLGGGGGGLGKFVTGLLSGGAALGQLKGGLGGIASLVGSAFGPIGSVVGAAVGQIGDQLVGAIKKAGKALWDLAAAAAPLEGLEAQFFALNQSFAGGGEAMLAALQESSAGMLSNRDLMLKFNEAASLISVDVAQRLPEAMEHLIKVSAATGTSLDYLFGSLVTGVGKTSPMVLDNLKIQISEAEAVARASKEFGKEADALTKVEKQTALMSLTLERLAEKTAGMPDVTMSTSVQMQALGAQMRNIKDTIGQALGPAFNTILQALR